MVFFSNFHKFWKNDFTKIEWNHLNSTFPFQGSDAMAIKTAEVARRYESLGRVAKNINPPMDIGHFIKTLHIPESMMVSKHKYALPQLGEPLPVRILKHACCGVL